MKRVALLLLLAGCAHAPLGATVARKVAAQSDDQRVAEWSKRDPAAAAYLRARLARERGRDADAFAASVDLLRRPSSWASPAVAVIAAHTLDELATEVGRPLDEAKALDELSPVVGTLPAEARMELQRARAKYARLRGADDQAAQLEVGSGELDRWRVAGPVGELPRLELAARALGSGDDWLRSAVPDSHLLVGPRHALVLESRTGQPGVMTAATDFDTPTAQKGAVVRVETGEAWLLYVDGKLAYRSVDEDRAPARVQLMALPLSAGTHRLLLAVAASGGRAEVDVLVLPERVDVENATAMSYPDADSVPRIGALLSADLAQIHGRSNAVAASDTLRAAWPGSGLSHVVTALAQFEDTSRPPNLAHDIARRSLEHALSLDTHLHRARDLLALLELTADRPRQALVLLDADRADESSFRPALLRYQAYRARNWKLEANAALDEAEKLGAGACSVLDERLAERRDHHDVRAVLEIAQSKRRGCEGGNTDLADAYRDQGDLPKVLAEYQRLLATDPENESWKWGYAEALVQHDDLATAEPLLTQLVAAHPRRTNYRRLLADLYLARHNDARARHVIEEGLAHEPENLELGRSLEALCAGRRPCGALDDLRVDGKAIIADYRARHAGQKPSTPAEIVLDRTVTRVFDAGGRLTITHNIIAVFDKDGLEKWGEVQIPAGADVLTLRTVKGDGTTREPEDIAGKATISAPDLEVGDFVEFEYVEPAAPPGAFANGFLSERFYFRSSDAPLDRTELLLVTPRAMTLQVDARGHAPTAVVVERADGTTLRTFAARQQAELFIEPQGTPFQEDLPSVRVGAGVSMSRWRDYLREQAFGADRGNDELVGIARSETAKAKTVDEKITALDRWVRRNIRGGGRIDEAATFILARREGNRERVLSALLRAVGIASSVAIARPVTAPRLGGALPDLESFDQGVLYVAGRFIDSRYKHTPTGFVIPALRGGDAIVLAAGPLESLHLPTQNDDARDVALVVKLDGSGAAEVEATETMRGWPALEWREALEKLPPDRLRPEFEQHTLGFYFPGSSLLDLSWSGADGDDSDFVVRYRFAAPQLGRRVGDTLVLPAPYPALLARRYVTVAARQSTLHVDYAAPTKLTAKVALPDGLDVVLPAPVHLDGGFGTFAQVVQQKGRTLYLDAIFDLPDQRVAPDRYAAFVDFAAAVDRAEARAAELRPAPKKAQN